MNERKEKARNSGVKLGSQKKRSRRERERQVVCVLLAVTHGFFSLFIVLGFFRGLSL